MKIPIIGGSGTIENQSVTTELIGKRTAIE